MIKSNTFHFSQNGFYSFTNSFPHINSLLVSDTNSLSIPICSLCLSVPTNINNSTRREQEHIARAKNIEPSSHLSLRWLKLLTETYPVKLCDKKFVSTHSKVAQNNGRQNNLNYELWSLEGDCKSSSSVCVYFCGRQTRESEDPGPATGRTVHLNTATKDIHCVCFCTCMCLCV